MKRSIGFYLKNHKKISHFDFIDELELALKGCESVLDIGCGSSSPIKHLPKKFYAVGCDSFPGAIEKSQKEGIHDQYRLMNVLDLDKNFPPQSFDCVLALDLIEHLEKEEGVRLIAMMEKTAKKKVVIFTPNGFLPQQEYENNLGQIHKSGWSVEEMKEKGFRVKGIMGWKALRGNKGSLKFSPKTFWAIISNLTQMVVKKNPEWAFQILCVKDLSAKDNSLGNL
jgi:SAM-dependent methyltransferase